MTDVDELAPPPPLSFPAILRNHDLTNRFAHLHTQVPAAVPLQFKRLRGEEKEGKRWIRRKDNARFTGNPHIVAATRKDFAVPIPQIRPTFPEPLPAYLPRNTKVPSAVHPTRDPASANAGRFSLSLKGIRKDLRRSGLRAQMLVRAVEDAITEWLHTDGSLLLDPASKEANPSEIVIGDPDTPTITELSRTPLEMVWSVNNDPFARYVVHCCARYHEVVSFSKEVSGRRLTYLLRPNVYRPDRQAVVGLDTPPQTDLDHTSQLDTESDVVSDYDQAADSVESNGDFPGVPSPLLTIREFRPAPPYHTGRSDDGWSLVEDADVESDNDGVLAESIDSLSLEAPVDPEDTLKGHDTRAHQALTRSRVWEHQSRCSASSPSRSPGRRPQRRLQRRVGNRRFTTAGPISFYEYLFA